MRRFIVENRMVRGAAELLLRFPRLPARARKRLLRIRATLEDVAPAVGPTTVPLITRLNQRYGPALQLASMILEKASITTQAGEVRSTAFVFDMNKVFEDFLSTALRESLMRFGGRVQLQYGRQYLDHERALRLIPDITWWRRGQIRAVVDAKFKALVDHRFPNADAYQMLAYCTALDLPTGYLVYARDSESSSREHHVRELQTVIKVRTVDVEVLPDDVLADVDRLAAEIASVATVAA